MLQASGPMMVITVATRDRKEYKHSYNLLFQAETPQQAIQLAIQRVTDVSAQVRYALAPTSQPPLPNRPRVLFLENPNAIYNPRNIVRVQFDFSRTLQAELEKRRLGFQTK